MKKYFNALIFVVMVGSFCKSCTSDGNINQIKKKDKTVVTDDGENDIYAEITSISDKLIIYDNFILFKKHPDWYAWKMSDIENDAGYLDHPVDSKIGNIYFWPAFSKHSVYEKLISTDRPNNIKFEIHRNNDPSFCFSSNVELIETSEGIKITWAINTVRNGDKKNIETLKNLLDIEKSLENLKELLLKRDKEMQEERNRMMKEQGIPEQADMN